MTILALIDHEGGAPTKGSAQVLTAAARLDGDVHAAVFGPGADHAADAVGRHGASVAWTWPDDAATAFVTEPQVRALEAAMDASGADTLLFPSVPFVTDVVARTAIRRGAGVITDAIDLAVEDGALVATKAIFGGDMTSRCRVRDGVAACIGVKANAFAAEATGAGPAEVRHLDVELDDDARRAEVVEVVTAGGGDRPEMTEAAIVVAGGRGLGDAEAFGMLERLADALGGAVGASRAATDAGWYPHQHQIGQTGKTIAPQLYLGIGISGAIQHRAGMQTAQRIAVVNTKPDEPLFGIADFGVVGDLHAVVPALIEEVERRST